MVKRLTPHETGRRSIDEPAVKDRDDRKPRFRKALERVNSKHGETLKRLAQ